MNAENFMEYLAQPAKLYQLPYQEIKNLVEEYPYSANLRQLLLLKSRIEKDPKFEQYLHNLAAHTFDREHLYTFIHEKLPQLLELDTEPEERLELKDLTQLVSPEKVPVRREEDVFEVGGQKSEVGSNEMREDLEESSPLGKPNISEFRIPPDSSGSDFEVGGQKSDPELSGGSNETYEDQEERVTEFIVGAASEGLDENSSLPEPDNSDFEVGSQKSEVGSDETHEEQEERVTEFIVGAASEGLDENSSLPEPDNSDFEVGSQKSEVGSDETHEDQEEQVIEFIVGSNDSAQEENSPLAKPNNSDFEVGSQKSEVGSNETHEDQEEQVIEFIVGSNDSAQEEISPLAEADNSDFEVGSQKADPELSGGSNETHEDLEESTPLGKPNTSEFRIPPDASGSDFEIPASLLQTLISGSLLVGTPLVPKAKENFASWQSQRQRKETASRWERLRQRSVRSTADEENPLKAKEMAKQSVQDQANLASETLAKLLTRQGQYRKAIKIYERLSLLYPEKSRYFAATIEELKLKQ
ncbi:hypothetical protein [Lewinella sp. LCG006]|uniref:hypothetical protein n=1 Tax=Lewinella sp. LCG006 TaxID=3231911 RepID=UPI00345F473A